MGRTALTLIGIAALAIGAVIVAQKLANPTKEGVERGQKVLTQAYRPRLESCHELEDADVPEELPRPEVDEDLVYVAVVVLYPDVDRVPSPLEHRLVAVNGGDAVLEPAHHAEEVGEEGAYLTLVFRTDHSFAFARLVRGEEVIADRVAPE